MLRALVHNGILKGVRGLRGGYKLARDGDRISAEDILRAVIDEIWRDSGVHSNQLNQTVTRAIEQVEKVFCERLARISLDDLICSEVRCGAE